MIKEDIVDAYLTFNFGLPHGHNIEVTPTAVFFHDYGQPKEDITDTMFGRLLLQVMDRSMQEALATIERVESDREA